MSFFRPFSTFQDKKIPQSGKICSKKYQKYASETKASYCITTQNLKDYLPSYCKAIIVENVLIATSLVTRIFYPDSIEDEFDTTVSNIEKTIYQDKKCKDYKDCANKTNLFS